MSLVVTFIILVGAVTIVFFSIIFSLSAIDKKLKERQRIKKEQQETEKRIQKEENRKIILIERYKYVTDGAILFNNELETEDKIFLLQKIHNYSYDTAVSLCRILKYKDYSIEQITFSEEITYDDKKLSLALFHKYKVDEAIELLETATKEARKAKLSEAKRKIAQKAAEIYSNIPSDDERKPIPDDVKMFVWQRDKGKCAKCGSQENLEYDHIIPVVKGGSSTERNIQLLCEKCNREKHDSIT